MPRERRGFGTEELFYGMALVAEDIYKDLELNCCHGIESKNGNPEADGCSRSLEKVRGVAKGQIGYGKLNKVSTNAVSRVVEHAPSERRCMC